MVQLKAKHFVWLFLCSVLSCVQQSHCEESIILNFIKAETLADFSQIETLADIIWREHYTPIIGQEQVDYMLDKFQSVQVMQEQTQQAYYYYQILNDKEPAGYLAFIPKQEHLFLSKVYLLSNQRGLGFGRKTMDFVGHLAKEFNLDKIRLTVNKYNLNTIEAYKKLGFVVIDSVVVDIGQGFVMDDYVMELML